MTSEEFRFNFKFKLHKSNLPIGIDDEDYPRLSAVYGVPLREVAAEAAAAEAGNRAEAEALLARFPGMADALRGRRIAFLGDSITSDRRSYLNILRAALHDVPDAWLADFSVSAYKVVDVLTNLVPAVTDFAPDIVHIMIGTNDFKRSADALHVIELSAPEYLKDLTYIVRVLRGAGAHVILSTLPPFDPEKTVLAFRSPANLSFEAADRREFNDLIRRVCAECDCILNEMEPVYAGFTTAELTEPDGLHLNAQGHRLLVAQITEKLLQAAR